MSEPWTEKLIKLIAACIEDHKEFVCPHCFSGYIAHEDDQYRDDKADNNPTTCVECGEQFFAKCVGVVLYFETEKLPA